METLVLEGTLTDVQNQMKTLPIRPERRVRVVVTEAENTPGEDWLATAPRRNGLILVPTKDPSARITVELVKELSEG